MKISQQDYLALQGARALADRYDNLLTDLVKLCQDITNDREEFGHVHDFIYGGRALDELLPILKIEVE